MASSSSSTTITELEHIVLFNVHLSQVKVASVAILVFDYFLTFELEMKYIWSTKWSIPNLMFLFTRYLPFVESCVLFFRIFSSGLSTETCNQAYKVNALLILVGIIVAEIILSLRTWAVWGQNKVVGIGLVIFSFSAAIPAIPVIVLFSGTAKSPLSTFPWVFSSRGSRILSIEWILLMIYDGGLLTLMAVQALKSLTMDNETFFKAFFTSSKPGELLKPILKDGILYYFYLFVLSALNVVVIRAMPIDYLNLLTMLERVIHAILTCRVVLHIKDRTRTEAYHDSLDECYLSGSSMQFNESVVQRTGAEPEP
ncbi:hypothetical protein BDQ17DRAFT_1361808 [Cyathus striatus]|nr:hypothetical protein BDQ17DRAFT_1361808 [Cyathus striatus]